MRQFLKRTLPAPIRHFATGCEAYGRRMRSLAHMGMEIRGITPQDQAVVRKTLLDGPFDMLGQFDIWREPQLVADADVEARGLGRFAVRAQSDDLHHIMPSTHTEIFDVFARHLKPGDVAIDAGANIGAVTVFMAGCVGPQGRTIAVEMMPDTATQLRRNLALNGLDRVELVELALSDTAGQTIVAEVAEGIFGQASILASANAGREVRRVEVKTTTLDAMTAGIERIAAMKLDLEGAEPMALAGAGAMLQRTAAIVFESWAGDGGETAAILQGHGFAISPIDGRNFLAARQV